MDLGDFDTALDVKDIERTAAFYEALGFTQTGGNPEVRTMSFERGDCRICLYQDHLDPARTQLIFWHGDIDAILDHVKGQGIPLFRDVKRDEEGGAAFMIEDPDDNPIFFINLKTHYRQFPEHATPAASERPAPLKIDPVLGWYELSLDVKDIACSEAFYRKLGFEVVIRETNDTRVSMQNGDCRIGLFQGHLNPPGPQLIFWQGDLEAVARQLDGKAAWERAPTRNAANGHSSGSMYDPDGHFLYFINIPGFERLQVG